MSPRRNGSNPLAEQAFATVLETSAAPYGYTLTIWSAGALLIHFRGSPAVWNVFLFVAGALAGFTLLGLFGTRLARRRNALPQGPSTVMAGMMSWLAVGLAVGAATLIAKIPSWVAWPAASLAATTLFLAAASIQLAVAKQEES